jgi:hypothetical protein
LRATLTFLEKVTLAPKEIVVEDLIALRMAGISDRAILDATYVCVGFNIIARISDALGFNVPSEEQFSRSARLLVIFGYKRLSGFWTGGYNRCADLVLTLGSAITRKPSLDPYDRQLRRLRNAVLSGPGSLSPAIRQSIGDALEFPGRLGAYTRKVAEQAYRITDDDIAELHLAHYTDDQIFEATVSASLGAGLLRLDCVQRALG